MPGARLSDRGEKNLLLATGGIALLIWLTPMLRPALLPLVYLNTHLHELCHGIAAVATGGVVHHIEVHGSGSGLTVTLGGWPVAISSAGYFGASLFGAVMVVMSSSQRGARTALLTLGTILTLGLVLWVRGDAIGFGSGVLWIVVLFALAKFATGNWLIFAAQFLGMTQCLAAAQSLGDLVFISTISGARSDAHNMYLETGIPPLFWAIVWILFSGIACVIAVAMAWKRSK
ncbi:MAG: M50 family metallopeptidase [Fimbriimonadales bacterium]|nr:M50 family metallopeptidase [Fimbriimonadales bacterium]